MKARMEQNSGGGRQRENMEEGFRTLSYSVVPASTPVSSFTSLTAVSATARNPRLITHETHKWLNTIQWNPA